MTIWSVQLVFDCADPDAVARFWGRALEYRNDLPWASDEEIAAFREAYPHTPRDCRSARHLIGRRRPARRTGRRGRR